MLLFFFPSDSEVNCICWADSVGSFLLVAEHSGLLHTVHTKSQRVINSEKVYQSYNDVSKTFLQLLVVEESSKWLKLTEDNKVSPQLFLNTFEFQPNKPVYVHHCFLWSVLL